MSTNRDDDFIEILNRMFKGLGFDLPINLDNLGPDVKSWSYGYSITMGPDGKPVIREFGNGLPERGINSPNLIEVEESKPLTQVDVNDEENTVRVLVEVNGVTKENIIVTALENVIKIKAEQGTRKFDIEIPIKVKVDPNSAEATYNNGILDLSLKIVDSPEDEGVNIKVK